jgi:alpha-2-macroglobulin
VKQVISFFQKQKWFSLLSLFVFLLSVNIYYSCKSKASHADTSEPSPVERLFMPDTSSDQELKVLVFAPEGEVKGEDNSKKEIVVTFNHPIVPLAMLEDETKGVFSIEPTLKGKFRWYGSRICAFIPETGYSPGVNYTVTVDASLVSLQKTKLSTPVSFSFFIQPDPLMVNYESPYGGSRIPYQQDITLYFNKDMNVDDIQKKVQLTASGKPVSFTTGYVEKSDYSGYDQSPKSSIKLVPKVKFPRDSEVKVIVPAGLTSLDKINVMSEERVISYTTYGPLTVSLSETPKTFQDRWYFSFEFNNPIEQKAVIKAATFEPKVEAESVNSEIVDRVSVSTWKLKPGKKYTVTFGSLVDAHGNLLTGNKSFTFTMPDYAPDLYLEESENNVIEAKGVQKIPLMVYNMPNLEAEVIQPSLSDILSIDFNSYNYKEALFSKISKQPVTQKTGLKFNDAGRVGFDLQSYIDTSKKGWVGVSFKDLKWGNRVLVQSTDLGITAKKGENGSGIWVHSLHDAKPIPQTSITLYDGQSSAGECVTNKEGMCTIKHGNLTSPLYYAETKDADKAFITAEKNKVYSNYYDYEDSFKGHFLFDRKLYRPGEKVSIKAVMAIVGKSLSPLKGQSVSLSVSSPSGETIFNKALVTSKEGTVSTELVISKEAPLGHHRVSIQYGDKSITDTFQVEEFRPVTFAVDVLSSTDKFKVNDKANFTITGMYMFGAPMSNAPVTYSSTRGVKGIDFENYPGYSFGDESYYYYDVDHSGTGYFKGGNGKLDGSGKMPVALQFSPMEVKEELDNPKKTYIMSKSYYLNMEASVKDIDDKRVTKTKQLDVYTGDYQIGIKTNDRYKSIDKPFSFELVAVSNSGEKVSGGKSATVRVIQSKYNSVKVEGSSGGSQTVNKITKELIEEKSLTLSSDPSEYSFTAKEAGEYTITVQEKDGQTFSRMNFYAYGKSEYSWYQRDDDSIQLIADKKEYKPGDVAKIIVQSPYKTARAIITVERNNIISQETKLLSSDSIEPIEVPIKEEHLPNIFVSVAIIKPRTTPDEKLSKEQKENFLKEDLGVPAFKLGVIQLNINTTSKVAKLDIKANKEFYEPRQKVILTIQSEPNSEVAVSVADRGVLDLVNYSYPNTVENFYKNWSYKIHTFDNRRFIIRQYKYSEKGANPGGDFDGSGPGNEDGGGFAFDSEDGTRKDFRYTAYWNPAILTDSSGFAQVEFTLPDNLTTFKIMGHVSSAGRYKNAYTEIKVKKPIILQKLVPAFIRPGDELDVGAIVFNQTSIGSKFVLSLESSLLVIKEKEKIVKVEPGKGQEVNFTVSLDNSKYAAFLKERQKRLPTEKLEPLQVKLKLSIKPENIADFDKLGLSANNLSDALALKFPIKEAEVQEAFSVAGFTDANKMEEFVQLPDNSKVIPELSYLGVSISGTVLNGLRKGFDFYSSNPYLCLEQRASAYLLAITSGELLNEFAFTPPDAAGYDFKNIDALFMGEITKFQNSDGSVKLWKESTGAGNPYLSAYVAFVFQIAKEKNKKINEAVYERLLAYLKSYIQRPAKDMAYSMETLSLINYVFTKNKMEDKSLTKTLIQNLDNLSLRAKSNLALSIAYSKGIQTVNGDSTIQEIFRDFKNKIEVTTDKVSIKESPSIFRGYSFYSGGSALGAVLRAYIHLDRDNPLIPGMVRFIIADKAKIWSDTHTVGILALALNDYYRVYETSSNTNENKFSVKLNALSFLDASLKPNTLSMYTSSLAMNDKAISGVKRETTIPLSIEKSENRRLYYKMTLSYYPLLKELNARDEGLEVHREIIELSQDPKKAGSKKQIDFKRGEIYLCKVTVFAPKAYFNYVISSPIASNFEIVNTSFNTEKFSLGIELSKKSEPGDWWSNYNYSNTEYREDKVVITGEYLSPGPHEYFYMVRPLVRGKSGMPPTSAKLMYEPEVFGRTGSGQMIVK